MFGDRYSKDSLQILSKLKSSLPENYDHVFTFLNKIEERNKAVDEKVETAKIMISSHNKTKIIGGEKLENSMICTVAGGMTVPPNPFL